MYVTRVTFENEIMFDISGNDFAINYRPNSEFYYFFTYNDIFETKQQ